MTQSSYGHISVLLGGPLAPMSLDLCEVILPTLSLLSFICLCVVIAMDAPLADGKHLQKTRLVRGKRPGKQSSPRASVPLSVEEGSDSGDEYHDALPGEKRTVG